ncbi:timeless protein-domain-containing protein [Rhodotorula diobovata]|uniref:Timeless protein-domain-containing protein n=1 Tax=Rhodotorula diobovata TaxID=5288 RepID=A0A5C5G641_9BASI|nr:timeless protein-domain-containing protein [Rhodotorula diobovata]
MAPKHLGYGTDDEQEEDEQEVRSETPGYEEDYDAPGSAQQRKRDVLHAPISSVCAALGGFEEFLDENGKVYTAYSLGDQVVGCLKDLKRFWRMDEKDDDRTVARIFHEVGVLKKDLIPILKMTLGTGAKGDRIALACVELIGAMTWPINVAEELRDAQLLGELKQSMDYTTLIAAQRSYKAAILKENVLKHMMIILANSLSKSRRDRTPKDENVISLVLHVFRNLAYLTDRHSTSTSAAAIEDSSLQSDMVVAFQREGVLDLLLAMSSQADSNDYAPWNMVVLDILHLIYRGVRPDELMVPEGKVEQNRLRQMLDLEAREQESAFGLKGSRHSRFGTTISVQSNGKKYILHKQSTLAEGPEKTLDKIKRTKAKKLRQDDDLAPPSQMRSEAIGVLAQTSRRFIESAFNPFFSSVLRDIRMERIKVRESDTVRFLYLSAFFLEFFLLVYRDDERRGISHLDEEHGHDFGMVAEMTEPHAIGFVTMRMKNALEEKPPLWTDLHAGVECFTQILLVIEALQATGNQDHIDVAEILQNKLYYEAETLDMVVSLVTRYNGQSYKYLDAVLNLAYTLLRMLEKYSKSKAYMYVRKKKAKKAASKRKKPDGADETEGDGLGMGGGEDEEELEVESGTVSFGEHAFQFEKFEQRFADESVLATCMVHLESYKTFRSPEQMKRIVALMHRQAVKAKSEGLFYKPTVLELFRRIMEDRDIVDAREGPKLDLRKLIEYILRKFFKAVQDHPFLLLECFYPKTRTQLSKMRLGEADPYADSDDDTLIYKAKKIGEVEVAPGFTHTQQIGIAIACLVEAGDEKLIDLVKSQLVLASAARTEVVLTVDGLPDAGAALEDLETDAAMREKAAQLKGPSAEAVALFVPHNVDLGEDEGVKEAATVNAHFKLLMRLLSWESSEAPESGQLVWQIPASLVPSKLDADLKIVDDFLLDPVDPQNGKSASELLRKQRKKPVRRKRKIASEDEMEIGEDGEVVLKVKEKKKRQAKRKEEEQAYKSAQFITDSDDEGDEARDAEFFAREAALREKLNAGQISTALDVGSKKKKTKGKAAAAASSKRASSPAGSLDSSPPPAAKKPGGRGGKKKQAPQRMAKSNVNTDAVSDIEDDDELVSELRKEAEKTKARGGDDSMGEDEEAAPSSSGSHASGRKRGASASSNMSAPVRATGDAMSEDDEVVGAVSQAAKKRRVILDSDEE